MPESKWHRHAHDHGAFEAKVADQLRERPASPLADFEIERQHGKHALGAVILSVGRTLMLQMFRLSLEPREPRSSEPEGIDDGITAGRTGRAGNEAVRADKDMRDMSSHLQLPFRDRVGGLRLQGGLGHFLPHACPKGGGFRALRF